MLDRTGEKQGGPVFGVIQQTDCGGGGVGVEGAGEGGDGGVTTAALVIVTVKDT